MELTKGNHSIWNNFIIFLIENITVLFLDVKKKEKLEIGMNPITI